MKSNFFLYKFWLWWPQDFLGNFDFLIWLLNGLLGQIYKKNLFFDVTFDE